MKRKPVIAVVGRPNVGKSTFVNRLVGKRQSIVDDLPGVTRDRIYFDVEWQNKIFTVIDTGGIVPGDDDEIMLSIYDQAKIACEEADKIIFLVDGVEGVTPVDSDIANILRQSSKPVFLAVNKVDSHNQITMLSDFYSLAIGEPIAISALHGSGGVGDLLEEITADFEEQEEDGEDNTIKIAIVGRPNAGKSSIVNALLGEKRVIVSDISGTLYGTFHRASGSGNLRTFCRYARVGSLLRESDGVLQRAKVRGLGSGPCPFPNGFAEGHADRTGGGDTYQ